MKNYFFIQKQTLLLLSQESFYALSNWIKDARELARQEIVIVVCGNKSDLNEERVVQQREAMKFCQEKEVFFIETSALSGSNVHEAFELCSKKVVEKMEKGNKNNKKEGIFDNSDLEVKVIGKDIKEETKQEEVKRKKCLCG